MQKENNNKLLTEDTSQMKEENTYMLQHSEEMLAIDDIGYTYYWSPHDCRDDKS